MRAHEISIAGWQEIHRDLRGIPWIRSERPIEAAARHTRHHDRTQGCTRPSADGARVQELSEHARKAELRAQVHLWKDGAGRRGGRGHPGEVW